MTLTEVGMLLAKVQIGDNRDVDELVIAEWWETVGDLSFEQARDALRRFRRERPGVYLEPGHLLELAGVESVHDPHEHLHDYSLDVVAEDKRRKLEAAGVTESEYEARKHDPAWVAATFPQKAIAAPEREEWLE